MHCTLGVQSAHSVKTMPKPNTYPASVSNERCVGQMNASSVVCRHVSKTTFLLVFGGKKITREKTHANIQNVSSVRKMYATSIVSRSLL